MEALRYRAYAAASATKQKPARDANGNVMFDIETGAPVMVIVADSPVEEVVFSGDVVNDKAEFDAGSIVITRVVGYAGPVEAEVVAGAADIGAAGQISVDFSQI